MLLTRKQYIAARVVVSDDGCWLWQSSLDKDGYGKVAHRALGWFQVHRAAYREWVGPIPDGLELDHLCRVRVCCNPDHLEPVTHRENVRRSPLLTGPRERPRKRSTHCKHGHEQTAENVIVAKNGQGRVVRRCRPCRTKVI